MKTFFVILIIKIFHVFNFSVSDISVEGGTGTITRRRVTTQSRHRHPTLPQVDLRLQWKRILLLIIAITVHNIPEGLAVGVGFGAIGTSASATFYKAR